MMRMQRTSPEEGAGVAPRRFLEADAATAPEHVEAGFDPSGSYATPDTTRRDRWRFVRSALAGLALIVTIVVAAVTISHSISAGLRVPDSGPLRAVSASAVAGSDGHHLEVSVSISNRTAAIQRGSVWWVLSRPGSEPPWRHEAYHSFEHPLMLARSAATNVQWREDAKVPPGVYTVTVYVHVLHPNGQSIHSDSLSVVDLRIQAGSGAGGVIRHGPSLTGLTIEAASLSSESTSDPLLLHSTATLSSALPSSGTVRLRWDLISKSGADPSDEWWVRRTAMSASTGEILLPAQGSANPGADVYLMPPLGTYSVRLSLLVQGAIADQVLLDGDGLLAEHWDPSVVRTSMPGPVAVASVGGNPLWGGGHPAGVDVTLVNTTDIPQIFNLCGYASHQSDPAPWTDSVASSEPPPPRQIAPHALAHIDLQLGADRQVVAPGSYELSVWVNVLDDDGRMVVSDGIAALQLVTVTSPDANPLYPHLPAAPAVVGAMDASGVSPAPHAADGAPMLRNGSTRPDGRGLGSTPGEPSVQQPFAHRRPPWPQRLPPRSKRASHRR